MFTYTKMKRYIYRNNNINDNVDENRKYDGIKKNNADTVRRSDIVYHATAVYIKCSKWDTRPFSQTQNIKKYKLPSVFARHLSGLLFHR